VKDLAGGLKKFNKLHELDEQPKVSTLSFILMVFPSTYNQKPGKLS
jgi:hypothetical protein